MLHAYIKLINVLENKMVKHWDTSLIWKSWLFDQIWLSHGSSLYESQVHFRPDVTEREDILVGELFNF